MSTTMYFKLKTWNTRLGILFAVALLISLLIQDGQDAGQWMHQALNVTLAILMAATVLLQWPLQRLAFKEACDEVEGVSYEELVAKAEQEKQGGSNRR